MRLSVITPSYNQPDWLRLCIASIRDQIGDDTRPGEGSGSSRVAMRVEHLVQDAGTPGIRELAMEFGAEFRDSPSTGRSADGAGAPGPIDRPADTSYRLQIDSGPDGGMYDAINRGLRRSAGEICAYLNCDEQYLPGALEAVAARFAADPSLDILFADAVIVDGEGRYICHRKAQVPFRDQLWFRMPVLTCATFFRRRVFEGSGVWFDETKRVCGDVIWLMRAQERGLRMGVLRRFTSVFTDAGEALGLGSRADAEFLELRQRMPGRVRRFLPLYLLWHRVRSVISGIYRQAPFDYALHTRAHPGSRTRIPVPKPTQVWKTRLHIDAEAIRGGEEEG